jgi:hypothetical protein
VLGMVIEPQAPRWGAIQVPRGEGVVEAMKIGYVMVFGKMKVNMAQPMESVLEEMNTAYKKLGEAAETYGLKILLWGGPLGMTEDLVVVFDVGGSMDNYLKFLEENYANLPFTNMRTHPIVAL